jgi:mono/diheme cytochrome c family protein
MRKACRRWNGGDVLLLVVAILLVMMRPAVALASVTDPDDDAVTFARDVMPILQQNCQVCHQPGAIGPMSLMTYEEVRPWARVIKLRVEEREMPPYHYDTDVGIQELKHDGRLSEEEIRTISRWVDSGAPLGNLADMPPPVKWPDPSQYRLLPSLGEPDLVIRSEPYTVPASGQDLWWRPTVPTGLTSDRCIRAIEVKPSVAGRAVTHHANSSFRVLDENGEMREAGRLTEYALGKLGEIIPEGTCRTAPANSYVTWDIHYYPSGEEVVDDVVEIGLWLHPENYDAQYRQTLTLYYLQGDIDLPPHGTAMTQGFHSFDHPVRIDSFQPHGHLRLKAKSLEIFYPETGRREMVSMISNWNPGWHISHMYEEHVAPLMPAGAVMILTAWYDNTADNPHNPDPDQWVGLGNRTTDEMSHAWIAVTHLDEEGYHRLLAERGEGAEQGRAIRPFGNILLPR